ncbi:hypothetical protein E6C27_scaffold1202G00630 [Cucumis melo var. makuwa]|uniref:Reverse transcriptase n=1 Tax=Cucumis melo var. makuwa TaxID=1194695 RepID=A0A5A7TQS9_CUCMM|nr:hypothetical protein E6C27_scaffold1202G00630 [Cucumis melo var. makuwa]
MRRMIDHGIESPPKAKVPAKNAHRMTPLELAELRKQSKKLLSTGFSRPVQASYGTPILSLKKKDKNSQRRIKHSILNKLTASRKYPFPLFPNLFDRSHGINVLDHVVEFHQIEVGKRKIVAAFDERIPKLVIELYSCPRLANSNEQFMEGFLKRRTSSLTELLKEEDIQWGRLECQVAFNGLKQATIEGPSPRVADATKSPKVEAKQFNCMLEEYLHHFVDDRQKNWVQLLNVAQFGHSAQTDSLIKRSQFEIKGSKHSVLPPVTVGPYVGNNPQVHRLKKEREQMADIARMCLEEASRPMEERVDQKMPP